MPQQQQRSEPLLRIVTDWFMKACIGVITYMVVGMYQKIETIPLMDQRLKNLEERNSRLEGKVFALTYFRQPVKDAIVFDFNNILKTVK